MWSVHLTGFVYFNCAICQCKRAVKCFLILCLVYLWQLGGNYTNTGRAPVFTPRPEDAATFTVRGGPLHYEYQIHDLWIHFGENENEGSDHLIEGNAFQGEVSVVSLSIFRQYMARYFMETHLISWSLAGVLLNRSLMSLRWVLHVESNYASLQKMSLIDVGTPSEGYQTGISGPSGGRVG